MKYAILLLIHSRKFLGIMMPRIMLISRCVINRLKIKPHRLLLYIFAGSVSIAFLFFLTTFRHHPTPSFHTVTPSIQSTSISPTSSTMRTEIMANLSQQFSQSQQTTQQQLSEVLQQFQALRQQLKSLVTQADIEKLQHTLQAPNLDLQQQLHQLQRTVKTFEQTQQHRIEWLPADILMAYFRLVAVQGFSDGIRAVIDVNGHQTTLARNESCPACHGWTLYQLDFIHQQAIFQKPTATHQQRVRLTVGETS